MVTIPREEYDRLREAADDLADLSAYDGAKAAPRRRWRRARMSWCQPTMPS